MARVKVKLADNIARVVFLDDEATKGATLGTNLYLPDGTVASPATLAEYIGAVTGQTATAHRLLLGLTVGNDHPQYTRKDTLTTRGDLYARGASTVERFALGTAAQVLRSNGTDPTWQTVSPVITLGTDLSGNVTLTDLGNGTLNATIVNNAVTDTKLRDSVGVSVIGRTAGTTGDPGDIVAGADGDVLRRAGGVLGFGTVSLAAVNFANPTASVGLTAVNGTALTAMRSDGAPALDVSISPTWSGTHTWSNPLLVPNGTAALPSVAFASDPDTGPYRNGANAYSIAVGGVEAIRVTSVRMYVYGNSPGFAIVETDQASGERNWATSAAGKVFSINATDDNDGTLRSILAAVRGTGSAITTIAFGSSQDFPLTDLYTNQLRQVISPTVVLWTGDSTGIKLVSGQFQSPDGTVGAPGFSFTGDLDCGWYRIGTNNIGATVAGAKVLDVSTTGLSVTGTITGNGSGLTTLNASNISSGTLADARLSLNVMLEDVANVMNSSTGSIRVGASAAQSNARLNNRASGNAFEWGHSNTGGYQNTLGFESGNGRGFVAFAAEQGTNSNTYQTRGVVGSVITNDTAGGFVFGKVATATADNQSLTTLATLSTGGNLSLSVSGAQFLAQNGTVSLPGQSFVNEPDCGAYVIGTNNIGVAVAAAKVLDIATTGLSITGTITTSATTFLHRTTGTLANGAAAQAGTLTNAPTAGNPTKWIPIDDNGTTRYIPAW